MNQKLYDLLSLLSTDEYHVAAELAERLSISEKTVRTRMKALDLLLGEYGAGIKAKRHYGYRLVVHDASAFVRMSYHPITDSIPNSGEDRQRFLLRELLASNTYVKLDDLSDQLFISRTTLSANLKRVEEILALYDLTLNRRPKYGVKILGSEFNKRLCIAHYLFNEASEQEMQSWLAKFVLQRNIDHKVIMTEIALESFVKYVCITIMRLRKGYYLDEDSSIDLVEVSPATQFIIDDYAKAIEVQFAVTLTSLERIFLSIHFSSNLSSNSYSQYGPNFIITGKIDELVFKMLTSIFDAFGLDFRNNLELRMALNQHLVPMDIRMRYNIPAENPLLDQIKSEYSYPFTLAITACLSLQEYYRREIPMAEVAYIAIIFALATEKRNRQIERKNIVLVCVTGTSSNQLFKYKYKQAFGDYIDHIYDCTIADLDRFDFSTKDIDYIFTTVPLNKKYPVPIYEINLFIGTNDILVYSEMFENSDQGFLLNYYSTNLFIPRLAAETADEVIAKMCAHTTGYGLLPSGFEEAVLKREELGQTDFGNLVALPHPYKIMTEDTFVTVAVLEKPILWKQHMVQVVFMVSIGSKEDEHLEQFYQRTTGIFFKEAAIKSLIAEPTFERLLVILRQ